MKLYRTRRLIAAGALICSASLFETQAASFLISDVTHWVGLESGVNVSQAVMVIQWPSQVQALAWGYRWQSSEAKTGGDMLEALVAASNGAFSAPGLDAGFVNDLQWQGYSFPGYDSGTGKYLQYFVNNSQKSGNYANGAAPDGAHILPPLGSPYDESGPGAWVASNTGVMGRPLVDGSWDGWVYSAYGDPGPAQAVDAPKAIPEAGSFLIISVFSLRLLRRRRAA